mgnify:FL=1
MCNYCTTTTPTTTTVTTPSTTTTTVTTTTTLPPLCPRDDGCNVLSLNFIKYDNPTDEKATNVPCDVTEPGQPNNFCDIVFEVCVSDPGKQ